MPKLKTHRGAAKRFKKTASGKFMRAMAFKRHMRGTQEVDETDAPRLRRMLPYK